MLHILSLIWSSIFLHRQPPLRCSAEISTGVFLSACRLSLEAPESSRNGGPRTEFGTRRASGRTTGARDSTRTNQMRLSVSTPAPNSITADVGRAPGIPSLLVLPQDMDSREAEQIAASIPGTLGAIRDAVRAARILDGVRLRFELPAGTLTDCVYDMFRPTRYLLNCVQGPDGRELAFITRKVIVTPRPARCYHATKTSSLLGIKSLGLLIGRDVPGIPLRTGAYTDSKQYIHATLMPSEGESWYYDRLGNEQAGEILEIDLKAAGWAYLSDPRGDEGIVETTCVAPKHITGVIHLPSVAEMRAILDDQGWAFQETLITSTLTGTRNNRSFSISRATLPGAWRAFYMEATVG
jgi:hypothetical protein